LDRIEKPFEKKPLELLLPEQPHGVNADIDLETAVAGYPGSFHLQPISLHIPFAARRCFIGLNGAGKTTLLNTLTGTSPPLQGAVRIGSGLHFGHLMQEHESLDLSKTLLQTLQEKTSLEHEVCYFLLDVFSLDPERASDLVGSLSPGGRVRLILATFSALRVNALVLDEPTNHLDLEALAALEEAMERFQGTILLVSHDRAFIERLRLDRFYLLDQEGALQSIPDYGSYVQEMETKAVTLLQMLKHLH
jgi:ATPase subunit of ABC transporter with duplicated ATPase domains